MGVLNVLQHIKLFLGADEISDAIQQVIHCRELLIKQNKVAKNELQGIQSAFVAALQECAQYEEALLSAQFNSKDLQGRR